MSVEADLGVVGEVGAQFQQKRAEVLVENIPVVMIDHRGGFNDPRVGALSVGATAPLGAADRSFLLRLA